MQARDSPDNSPRVQPSGGQAAVQQQRSQDLLINFNSDVAAAQETAPQVDLLGAFDEGP